MAARVVNCPARGTGSRRWLEVTPQRVQLAAALRLKPRTGGPGHRQRADPRWPAGLERAVPASRRADAGSGLEAVVRSGIVGDDQAELELTASVTGWRPTCSSCPGARADATTTAQSSCPRARLELEALSGAGARTGDRGGVSRRIAELARGGRNAEGSREARSQAKRDGARGWTRVIGIAGTGPGTRCRRDGRRGCGRPAGPPPGVAQALARLRSRTRLSRGCAGASRGALSLARDVALFVRRVSESAIARAPRRGRGRAGGRAGDDLRARGEIRVELFGEGEELAESLGAR